MPWPMVHFAIAEQASGGNASPSLLLGSIAPDAIHAREHATRADKRITHLMTEGGDFPTCELLRSELSTCLDQASGCEERQYIHGYFLHIYTDIRWTLDLYSDFEAGFHGTRDAEREAYHKEVSQLEFILLRSGLWSSSVFDRLVLGKAGFAPSLVKKDEVLRYREMKLEWLRESANEPRIAPDYFTEELVRDFIDRTSEEWRSLLIEWRLA
ncbi:hypothetical protein [Paenibacillus soyae]|uniref:Phospholipase C/D domain-containing protein n=1 Tax=Paenibacillus soyae TaxID=2969249 RepID=A0A9X2S822_9BACL|nr:hypothetical protein [Paenibacillus soyae]MCR2803631.1 hypothetical protein [Paenibacillus soyae]